MSHSALIGVQASFRESEGKLKSLIKSLGRVGVVKAVSSIFQFSLKDSSTVTAEAGRESGISVALELTTDQSARELLQSLIDTEKELNFDHDYHFFKIYFLSYDSEVAVSSGLNLPYPDWHLRPQLMVPAKEIHSNYVHPVLGKALSRLADEFETDQWGKFYAQGKTLLEKRE